MELLSDNELKEKIKNLPGWEIKEKSISKEFHLKNFAEAIAFIVKVSFEAEKMDHHPDIHLHSYNKVAFSISTHSKGGITENDFKLARLIENMGQ